MAGRSYRFSGVLAILAVTGVGCAEGASENANVPPLDGIDTGAVVVDETGADTGGGSDTSVDSTVTDTGMAGDSSGGDGGGCDPAKGLTISCGVGECTVTMPACSDAGVPNTCKPKDPGVEVCNGKDDDCDGTIDEDLGETECGKGECTVKQKNCVDGSPKTCTPKAPGVEVCDGKDNDCDGNIDNGFPTDTCGVGECKVTVSACSGGMPGVCTPKMPTTEICNGKDDDCDGTVDDGIADVTCGSGVCANTAPGCVSGAPGVCIPKDLGIEACGVGECINFVSKCIGGVPQTCAPKPAGVESCNGRDDDCDGTPDNGAPAAMCPPGTNVSTTECAGGLCKIKNCAVGYADTDGDPSNGCECAASAVANACPGKDLFTFAVGVSRNEENNLPSLTGEHWYKITFVDARSNVTAHPRIKLEMVDGTTPPLEFQVMQNVCGSGAAPSCGAGGTAIGRQDWDRYYDGLVLTKGKYGDANWTPILLGSTQNAVVYVKVTYKAGTAAATCTKYRLVIGN